MISNFDYKKQFEAIKRSATSAVQEIFPIEGKLRTIKLDKIWVDDSLDDTDYASQSAARAKEATWGTPVYASLSLIDKATGKTVDHTEKTKLFTLPKITQRLSYIVGGNEYQVTNQLRLKPGVYTIRKQNGELKTQVNLKGKSFDIVFNERTGVFYIQKIGGGQTNIPLYPILTYLGISPTMISKRWDSKLEAANRMNDPKAVTRAAAAFGAKTSLKEYFDSTSINPDTTKIVLGKSFERVDGPMLLEASGNLLDVHLGKKEATDRDSLAFKELLSVEDFLHERIQKNKTTLAFKLKRSIDNLRRTKISQLVNPGAFSSVIENFFTQDDKATTTEQTNPLEMLSGQFRVTVMGSGGITSRHAIKKETREIHPSHYGFIDPIHTPESEKIGVNLHLPIGSVKDGKELKSAVVDKNGANAYIDATTAFNKYIAFPDQKGEMVKAQYQGKVVEIPRSKVDYFTPSPQALFSPSTNLIPFLASNQGNRAMMASKMLEQAIALKHREAPLVQTGMHESSPITWEKGIGRTLAALAPEDGTVVSVSADAIVIKTDKGQTATVNLYNNFSLNRKSFMHHEALVKKGDRVKKGQIIADSNYTKGGDLALGTNMRVAYLPYKGLNFEDGIVITESAAQRLTSEHIHKKTIELSDDAVLGLNTYGSFYPNALTPENIKKLDKFGVIQKGEKVKQGDTLIALVQKRAASPLVATVSKALSSRPKDISVRWTNEDSGVVMDVQRSGRKITVFVKTEEVAKIGDKLSGRMGNKGIITSIVPDKEAPHDKKGNPIEIMLNPHGVITRINIGQIYESAAGKVALKKGTPYKVQNFTGEDYLATTKKLLADAGLDDKEELFDPVTKKSLGKVHVGNPYVLKLFKQGTVNFSVRQGGPGQPYDANQQPLKAGGAEAAKSMDLLTIYSMLSHGARANLREMSSIKSNQNDEFWKALKSGQQLPPPQTPFVYDKFINYLKGAGIDVKKDGSKLALAPLTDAQVRDMSSGEIKKTMFYKAKDLQPIAGGFFDKNLTGGFKGTKWNHVDLKEPVINPVFEGAVRKITGLGKKLDDVIAGKLYVAKDGTFNTEGKGVTGGVAVEKILKDVDVDKEIASLLRKSSNATGTALDDINKRLRYLQALKDNNMKPHEAYMRKAVPIIPAVFRPVYPLPGGSMASSDINYLYQNTGVLNEMMKMPVMDLLDDDEKVEIRKDLYEHVKGISGVTDMNIKGRDRSGFISEIKGGKSGGQPKEGFFISKMLSKKQDFVGRGTIIPEPDLGIDEIALPEEMAWNLFEPFLVRELKTLGKTPLQAKEEIKKKTPLAKKALEIVMKNRHVLLNRAPSLHKFSIMAFKPQITTGRAIKMPPLVTKGFNADYDGDCVLGSHFIYLRDSEGVIKITIEDFALQSGVTKEEIAGENSGVIQVDLPDNTIDVLALNTSTGVPEFQGVRAVTVHFNHGHAYEIKTVSGRTATVSDDHSLITMDEKGRFFAFNPRTHREGYCILPKKISLPPVTSYKNYRLTYELGFLIGYWVSDGCFAIHKKPDGTTHGFATRWHSTEEEVNKTLEDSFRSVEWKFTVSKKERAGLKDLYVYNVSGREIYEELLGLCGNYAANKYLPENLILNSNDEFRQGLLSGVMSGDGGCSESSRGQTSISLRVKSEEFCLTTETLLQTLGVPFTKTKNCSNRYDLLFRMPIPSDVIGPIQSCRKLVWEKAKKAYKTKFDCVPVDVAGLRALLKNKKIRFTANDFEHHFLNKSKEKTRLLCVRFAEKYHAILEDTEYSGWANAVLNKSIQFDKILSVTEVVRPNAMFDLSVPKSETFFLSDSVLSKNTMTVHTPITNEANEEAKKMLPSNNLFKPGTGALMIAPSQEAQIGLFYLSKTPAGIKQLAAIIGPKYPIDRVLNKKGTSDLLMRLAKELPAQEYAKVVAKLKSVGEQHAFDRGFTLGLNDIADMRKERNAIVNEALKSIEGKPTEAHVIEVNAKASRMMDALVEKKLKDKNNPLFDMVESGARGDRTQLRSIVATPLFVTDAQSKIVPTPIRKSYAEGLDISDYWVSLYGARRGGLDRSIQTSLPGAFSKDIMASTIDNVISSPDCGTKDGIILSVTDPDALERFLAGEQGGLHHNTLVDSSVVNTLSKKGLKQIKVRSPLTCHQSKGVCGKCHGLDEHGEVPDLGENIGAKAGQTIAEPLVQMIMNSRHTGGVAGTGSNVDGYARINQLLQLPKIVHGAATLAPKAGKITKIEKGLAGGFNVWVGTEKAFVPQGLPLKVAVGSTVAAGDPLSEGVIKPQELVKHKGMQAAQEYIVDELNSAYKTQGAPVQRRVFETVIRSLGNTTKVLNNPKDSNYLPGDVASYTTITAHNRSLKQRLPSEMAEGLKLAEDAGGLKAGKVLTHEDVLVLKAKSIPEVIIVRDEIKHAPFLKGMSALPLLRKDWMASLGYRYLAKTLTEGASQGWETDLSGYHPVPALAQGTTFGKGKEGKY